MLCKDALGIVGAGPAKGQPKDFVLYCWSQTRVLTQDQKMLRPGDLSQSKRVRIEPSTKFQRRMKMNTKPGEVKVGGQS